MSDSAQPLVTVVTIAYNAKAYIEETLNSVLGQHYAHLEYVAIDGGSTDGTVEILRRYAPHLAYWVSEPDRGISDAFNKGVAASTGEWINFMNAGDLFESTESVACAMTQADKPQRDLIYGQCRFMTDEGRLLPGITGAPFSARRLRMKMFIPHQSTFHRRRLFERYGGYSSDYKAAMDYEFLLRVQNLQVCYVNAPLARMRVGGVSQNNEPRTFAEYRCAQRQHGIGWLESQAYYRYFMAKLRLRDWAQRAKLHTILTKIRPINR